LHYAAYLLSVAVGIFVLGMDKRTPGTTPYSSYKVLVCYTLLSVFGMQYKLSGAGWELHGLLWCLHVMEAEGYS